MADATCKNELTSPTNGGTVTATRLLARVPGPPLSVNGTAGAAPPTLPKTSGQSLGKQALFSRTGLCRTEGFVRIISDTPPTAPGSPRIGPYVPLLLISGLTLRDQNESHHSGLVPPTVVDTLLCLSCLGHPRIDIFQNIPRRKDCRGRRRLKACDCILHSQ